MKLQFGPLNRECVEMEITSAGIRRFESTTATGLESPDSRFGAEPDLTYETSLGDRPWRRLAPEVQERFSAKPGPNETVKYAGTMQKVNLSFMGWLFAQACRLIGTPLAPFRGEDVPMRIELTKDETLGGVIWRRIYAFSKHGEFTVSSTKYKGNDGEVIENIGLGFLMRLRLTEESGALVFTSTAYECTLFGRRFEIPALITPGRTTVRHEQLKGDWFRFSLSVVHPVFGRTIYQEGDFYSVNDR